jgi:hypothetical protein
LDEREQQFTSRNLPLNIPTYREEPPFANGKILDPPEVELAARGIKSPVQRSPSGEHTMSVMIGTGTGGSGGGGGKKEEGGGERGEDYEQQKKKKPMEAEGGGGGGGGGGDKQQNGQTNVKGGFRPPPDTEFDLLMDAVERAKQEQIKRINEKANKFWGRWRQKVPKYCFIY